MEPRRSRLLAALAFLSLVSVVLAGCSGQGADTPAARPAADGDGLVPDAPDEPADKETPGGQASDVPGDVAIEDPMAKLRAAALAAASGGAPLRLTLSRPTMDVQGRFVTGDVGNESIEVDAVLRPSAVVDATTLATADGAAVALDAVAYEGEAKGDAATLVRLTIGPSWARASAMSGDHVFTWSTGKVATEAGPLPGSPVAAGPGNEVVSYGDDPASCLTLFPVASIQNPATLKPVVESGRSTAKAIVAQLAMVGEAGYWQRLGPDALPFLAVAAQELDLVYDHEVGIRMHLASAAVTSHPLSSPIDFDAMAARDAAATDGRDFTLSLDVPQPGLVGDGGGQANCIGAAGHPEFAFAALAVEDSDLEAIFFLRYLLGHETGHLFNADHHNGAVEGDAGTLMSTTIPATGWNPVFGPVERSFIRGWAEAEL